MTENLLVSLNDIEEKEASWLVPQRMPKGQIIILAGDGGSGKTSCWCSLAAAISTGAQVFFDETPKEFFESEPQKVLFFSSEDSLEYAEQFIIDFLNNGKKTTAELDESAEAAGISKNTLSRAKTELRKKKILGSKAEGFGNSKVFYSYLLSTSH